MKSIILGSLSFTIGACIGSYITYKNVKSKYEQIAQEEIDSVKELYSNKSKKDKENIREEKQKKQEINNYASILSKSGYTDYSKTENVENILEPHVILPEEYGENEYETLSYTFYADGILADEDDEIVENVVELVGKDFANHFGEYEDDSVFIRNDIREIDFEVLRDNRKYSEVVGKEPHLARRIDD